MLNVAVCCCSVSSTFEFGNFPVVLMIRCGTSSRFTHVTVVPALHGQRFRFEREVVDADTVRREFRERLLRARIVIHPGHHRARGNGIAVERRIHDGERVRPRHVTSRCRFRARSSACRHRQSSGRATARCRAPAAETRSRTPCENAHCPRPSAASDECGRSSTVTDPKRLSNASACALSSVPQPHCG